MSIFRSRTAFEIMRNLKAFLNLEGGLVRRDMPQPDTAELYLDLMKRCLTDLIYLERKETS